MQQGVSKPKPIWIAGLLLILGISVIALFIGGTQRKDPGEALQYDFEDYAKIDPSLIKFEETGQLLPELEKVRALATDAKGQIFVAGENFLVVLDKSGKILTRIKLEAIPTCIAVAPDGDILVGIQNRVEVLDSTGASKSTWQELDGRAYVTSIAVDENVAYVADAGNRVVYKFDRQGKLLGRIGEKDTKRGIPGLVVPSPFFDVAFDSLGFLWVVNPGRLGLEKYNNNGDLLTSWYAPSLKVEGFSGCCNPSHIAFRKDGSLVTMEKGLIRVKIYDVTGVFRSVVMMPGTSDNATSDQVDSIEASHIRDITVDALDRILILDAKRNVVRIFEDKDDA